MYNIYFTFHSRFILLIIEKVNILEQQTVKSTKIFLY